MNTWWATILLAAGMGVLIALACIYALEQLP